MYVRQQKNRRREAHAPTAVPLHRCHFSLPRGEGAGRLKVGDARGDGLGDAEPGGLGSVGGTGKTGNFLPGRLVDSGLLVPEFDISQTPTRHSHKQTKHETKIHPSQVCCRMARSVLSYPLSHVRLRFPRPRTSSLANASRGFLTRRRRQAPSDTARRCWHIPPRAGSGPCE
jgi:hypothetical protein